MIILILNIHHIIETKTIIFYEIFFSPFQDVYEYLSDSDVLLDSQERCIKTFKDQLAMYTSCSSPAGMMMNGVVEHTNRRS